MLIKIFSMALIFTFSLVSAEASLKKLSKELMEVNTSVLSEKTNINLASLNYKITQASKNWSLSASSEYEDDNLESAFSFATSVTNSITKTNSLTLSKSTFYGGEFSFTNSLVSIDAGSISTKTNGFSQTLAYSQDIGANLFGRNDRLDLEIASENYEALKIAGESEIEAVLLEFARAYSSARLNKSLLEMQKRALARSVKREKLIQRRVKDGLRERVDLYSAKTLTLSTKEEVQNSKMNFLMTTDSLAQALHRKVRKDEVAAYLLKADNFSYLPQGKIIKNKKREAIKLQMLKLTSQIKQDNNNILPTISLDTSYSSNDYDAVSSEAISNGTIGSDNKALAVGVNLTWTIGNEIAKITEASNKARLNLAKHRLKKSDINLKQTEALFIERIKLINKNLKSVDSRRELALKKLSEYNRLYKRGRSDLEQVIRAEEDLINTEISYARYLSTREGLIYGLATLYGNLNEELNKGI